MFLFLFFYFFSPQDWDVEKGLPRQHGPNADNCDSRAITASDGGKAADGAEAAGKERAANNSNSGGSSKNASVARRVACFAVKVVAVVIAFTTACAFVWFTMGLPFLLQVIVVAFIAYVASGGYKLLYLVYRTAPRDLKWVTNRPAVGLASRTHGPGVGECSNASPLSFLDFFFSFGFCTIIFFFF